MGEKYTHQLSEESKQHILQAAHGSVKKLRKRVDTCDSLSADAAADAMRFASAAMNLMTIDEFGTLQREIDELTTQFHIECVCRKK